MEFKYNTCACASKVQKFQGYDQIYTVILLVLEDLND